MKNLYRRYRPLKLSDVAAQSQVTDSLAAALRSEKVGHAYLFVGPRGCGKTSVARIFAHEANGFKYELEDDYVDIIEIDGASNRGIDDIRELREKATIAPTSGKYKVYIIDEVHMLTKEAFNALLKTLEEPPEHVIFIMATTDAHKVPVTITSRAQTYTFKLADAATMAEFLREVAKKEKIKITDEALAVVAKRGGGSFRDSLSLLDQISTLSDGEIGKDLVVKAMGLPEDEKIGELLEEYVSGDVVGQSPSVGRRLDTEDTSSVYSPPSTVKITTLLKDLLSAGVKPETLAEEMMGAIMEKPRAELMPLLAKLPEVKEPYAEARLLVALLAGARVTENAFFKDSSRLASSETYIPDGAEKAARRADFPGRPVYDVEDETVRPEKGVSGRTRAEVSDKTRAEEAAAPTAFDWAGFLGKIEDLNEVIFVQLKKCEHEMLGNTLHLYPKTKIIKNILEKTNNKQILVDTAGNVKIAIHEAGEHPTTTKKDATLDKISAIMGGEVINDHGGNDPF